MSAGRDIVILCFAPLRNRQGADLASLLTEAGHCVSLYQLDDGTSPPAEDEARAVPLGLPALLRPGGALSRVRGLQGLWRRLQFTCRPWHDRCEVVVAINPYVLAPAALLARHHRAKLVYYTLELCPTARARNRERALCARHADMIWSVESNRLALLTDGLSRPVPGFVVYNTPRAGLGTEPRGRLREYLRASCGVTDEQRLVVYCGSHQRYSCLESLVAGSADWHPRLRLVLMLTGEIGGGLASLIREHTPRVCVVPPVPHAELFSWLRDADLGLLPYEDEGDTNVRYCSPQKMFDYLACGVPFVGSPRPLIEEVVRTTAAGVCVSMSDPEAVRQALDALVGEAGALARMSANARAAYERQYNYDALVAPALEALLG